MRGAMPEGELQEQLAAAEPGAMKLWSDEKSGVAEEPLEAAQLKPGRANHPRRRSNHPGRRSRYIAVRIVDR